VMGHVVMGRGVYGGSSFDLSPFATGDRFRAAASFEVEDFSPRRGSTSKRGCPEAHPEDVTAMYGDETHTGAQLSEESILEARPWVHQESKSRGQPNGSRGVRERDFSPSHRRVSTGVAQANEP